MIQSSILYRSKMMHVLARSLPIRKFATIPEIVCPGRFPRPLPEENWDDVPRRWWPRPHRKCPHGCYGWCRAGPIFVAQTHANLGINLY